MNREEAREAIKEAYGNSEYTDEIIKALEREPCEDCISRQDVLDLAKKGVLVSNRNYKSVCKAINELPSVTPQPSISQPDIEAIRREIETEMNLCRAKDTLSYGLRGTVLKEVLDIIDKHIGTMREATPEERQSIDDYIDSISTKKQDSKIGYITIDDYGIMNTCSVCGYSIHSKIKNFCPNCGAKMVEPQESERTL